MNNLKAVIDRLSEHPDPTIRYWMQTGFLNLPPEDQIAQETRKLIASGEIAVRLLSERQDDGTIDRYPYQKWCGSHWVFNLLAEIDYPPRDEHLLPLRDQALGWIFSKDLRQDQTLLIKGLYRRHTSQEASLIQSMLKLDLVSAQIHELVDFLLEYQWPDGGWNCDKKRTAHTSSFIESIFPLRALVTYQDRFPRTEVQQTIDRALEFFLKRHLFKRLQDGTLIRPEFIQLTFPHYHFYTILLALEVIADAGHMDDPRCKAALDCLEEKYIPGQGWPLEKKFEQYSARNPQRYSLVRWSKYRFGKANEFITTRALIVLKRFGRL